MDLDAYPVDTAVPDEAFLTDGVPHRHWRPLYDALREWTLDEVAGLQERSVRAFSDAIGDSVDPVPLDCIPHILSHADWHTLEAGLTQRVIALNRFLNDIYATGRIARDGVTPADIVRATPQYRVEMRGVSVPHDAPAAISCFDLARIGGRFHVLRDNLRCPTGTGTLIALQRIVRATLSGLYGTCGVQEADRFGPALRATLCELATAAPAEPRIAVLTPGRYNAGFQEHAFLARELEAELVEGRDLLVDNGRVCMRAISGPGRQVDALYRHVDDDFLDPLAFRPDSLLGVAGLLHACKLGAVGLANAPGTGVADGPGVFPFVPDIIRYYCAEEPLLPNAATYLCRRPEDLEYTLDNLAHLVVHRLDSGQTVIGPGASVQQRADCVAQLRSDPGAFIARPAPVASRVPCLVDGRFEPFEVRLRVFVLQGARTRVVPGALAYAQPVRQPGTTSAAAMGRVKDVWVLAQPPER